ncbi:hypothetical protein LUZ16_29735, partial [Streptomyces albireticuli]|uniref:hypothetical protein n=1 Tax=Streptomyces albireticuli TaxID=1940 RepID=UPI001E428177
WGRGGRAQGGGWLAVTTDPIRHDLAWRVRYHPEHGRSVLIMRDDDAASMHTQWWGDVLLYRTGGYWWDGTTWYHPGQVWDGASERYDRRPVKAARTVTAAELLDDSADPAQGRVLTIANFDTEAPEAPGADRWLDDLALWAARRKERGEEAPLSGCVVRLSAPELAGDQLLGAPDVAKLAGIAASTLRAYNSRGEGAVPPPQATVAGRSMWARPVAEDWAEARRRSSDSVAATVASSGKDTLPVGKADLRERFARTFYSLLWEHPERRKRWVLRHRNEAAVRQVSDELAWEVAAGLKDILPVEGLAATLRHAVLDEFASGLELYRSLHSEDEDPVFFGILHDVARMLDWFIRHHPNHARYVISEIIGDAERRMEIPRQISARSLRTALALDGKLDEKVMREYLDRVLPPSSAP